MSGRSRVTPGREDSAAGFVSEPAAASAIVIGKIETLAGACTLTRSDGVSVEIKIGEPVCQGDIAETAANGLLGIRFVDGTAFSLSNSCRVLLKEFACEGTAPSALINVTRGSFAFVAGEMAKAGRLGIETPVASIRTRTNAGGIGMLSLTALFFAAMDKAQAKSPDIAHLDDDFISYKHLEHGVFELVTKEPIPRHIIVDDPGETVVLRRLGSSISEDHITNSIAQMVQLQAAQQDALHTYSLGLQGPTATGTNGSSSPSFEFPLFVQPINFTPPDNSSPQNFPNTNNGPTSNGPTIPPADPIVIPPPPPAPPPPTSKITALTADDSGGSFSGIVEEEQLGHIAGPIYPSSTVGNEDGTASPDNDLDASPNFNMTTTVALGSYLISGGTGPYTYHFAPSGIEGAQAQFTDSPSGITSHGAPVLFHVSGNTLIGYTNAGGGSYTEGVDHVVFTFQITNSTTGAATFRLYDRLDHHAAGDGIEGARFLNLNGIVQITDSSPTPQTLALNGSVGIIDDVPVATDITAVVNERGTGTTNFILTIDTSASMTEDPGVPGFATRLDLEKAALIDLLNSANVNQVFIVSFNTSATDSGGWLGKAAAIAFINGLTATGLTNYDAALARAQTAFTYAHTNADYTLSYFLSDGDPNVPFASPGIDASEQSTWESFLTANGVTESFAFGVGSGVSLAALSPIGYPDGDPNNPVVLTDQSQLSAALIASLPGTASGNVPTSGSSSIINGFGADGPGNGDGIVSITVDGQVYAYDANVSAILKNGNPFTSGTGTLEVDTTLGGQLTFHFTSGAGFAAGDWQYRAPANLNAPVVETFHYVIADGDGDQAGADLNVHVPNATADNVITNAGLNTAFQIPHWALLSNDADFDSSQVQLSISGVNNASDGNVNTGSDAATFTDTGSSGGTFNYTLSIGSVTDSGHVTIAQDVAGSLDGTNGSDILIGKIGGSTINGNGGDDVLVGNIGVDALDGGAGADELMGGSGGDTLTGGSDSDTFVFKASVDSQPGSGNFDTVTDFTAGSDYFDLLALAGATNVQGQVGTANTVAPNSVSWFVDSATNQTVLYVNTTATANHVDMEIHLTGTNINLTGADILHHT